MQYFVIILALVLCFGLLFTCDCDYFDVGEITQKIYVNENYYLYVSLDCSKCSNSSSFKASVPESYFNSVSVGDLVEIYGCNEFQGKAIIALP